MNSGGGRHCKGKRKFLHSENSPLQRAVKRLAVGMGGYIGGRSMEKVAGAMASAVEHKAGPRKRR
jgi:hypothetical protein